MSLLLPNGEMALRDYSRTKVLDQYRGVGFVSESTRHTHSLLVSLNTECGRNNLLPEKA
jgi:hypothetical protein